MALRTYTSVFQNTYYKVKTGLAWERGLRSRAYIKQLPLETPKRYVTKRGLRVLVNEPVEKRCELECVFQIRWWRVVTRYRAFNRYR